MRIHLACLVTVVVAAAVVATSARPLAAQPGTVQPGVLVRVLRTDAPSRPIVGTMIGRTRDSISVVAREGGAIVQLASASMQAIEIQGPRRHLVPALKWGMIAGGIWGGVVAATPYRACDPKRYNNCDRVYTKGELITTNAITMGVIFGLVGAWRGAESWVPVEGRSVTPVVTTGTHGMSLGMRVGL